MPQNETTTTTRRTLREIRALIRIENAKIRARRRRDATAAAVAIASVKALPRGERRSLLLSPKGQHLGEPFAYVVLYRLRLERWLFIMFADALALNRSNRTT